MPIDDTFILNYFHEFAHRLGTSPLNIKLNQKDFSKTVIGNLVRLSYVSELTTDDKKFILKFKQDADYTSVFYIELLIDEGHQLHRIYRDVVDIKEGTNYIDHRINHMAMVYKSEAYLYNTNANYEQKYNKLLAEIAVVKSALKSIFG